MFHQYIEFILSFADLDNTAIFNYKNYKQQQTLKKGGFLLKPIKSEDF